MVPKQNSTITCRAAGAGDRYLTIIIVAHILLASYALSYAPAYTLANEGQWNVPLHIFRPVEWAIDKTPLRHPLLAWAALWGVEVQMWLNSLDRKTGGVGLSRPVR